MKRLTRSTTDKKLGGVSAGLATYFDSDIDPTIIRVLFVILAFITGGTAILAYLILWVIIPEETSTIDTKTDKES